jgi:pimeloyl-ACP methyl ester carboxylesterase
LQTYFHAPGGQVRRDRSYADQASSEPAWKTVPSYFVYGDKDKNIPAQAQVFMAERAHAKKTVVVKGASHVVMVSNPKVVASLIETATTA